MGGPNHRPSGSVPETVMDSDSLMVILMDIKDSYSVRIAKGRGGVLYGRLSSGSQSGLRTPWYSSLLTSQGRWGGTGSGTSGLSSRRLLFGTLNTFSIRRSLWERFLTW